MDAQDRQDENLESEEAVGETRSGWQAKIWQRQEASRKTGLIAGKEVKL